MRVLHTVASLDPASGGPARSVPQLILALKKEGLPVSLWVASPPNPTWFSVLEDEGISVSFVEPPDLRNVDLIHDHGVWLPSNHRVAEWARAHRIPRLVSPRGMLEPWALSHKKWKKRLAWWLYQKRDILDAAALHATATSEKEQFARLGLTMPVFVIPNGVMLPEPGQSREHSPEMMEPGALKEASPFSPHAPLLPYPCKTALFLGRLHPKKGLPMLVEAWAKVRPAGWRMRVIGPDEAGHRAKIEALMKQFGIDADWSLEDPLSDQDKWSVIAAADLFILPTHSENFGISVAESLACGVPVITTTGAPWRGIEDHQCGWWVEPKMENLAAALAEASTVPMESMRAMGARGRAWVLSDFSWEGIARTMLQSYKALLLDKE